MPIQVSPITDNSSLDMTLFEMIKLINELEIKNVELLKTIKEATDFADLQAKVNIK